MAVTNSIQPNAHTMLFLRRAGRGRHSTHEFMTSSESVVTFSGTVQKSTESRTSTKKRRSSSPVHRRRTKTKTGVTKKSYLIKYVYQMPRRPRGPRQDVQKERERVTKCTCAPSVQYVTQSCFSRYQCDMSRLSRYRAQFEGCACAIHQSYERCFSPL